MLSKLYNTVQKFAPIIVGGLVTYALLQQGGTVAGAGVVATWLLVVYAWRLRSALILWRNHSRDWQAQGEEAVQLVRRYREHTEDLVQRLGGIHIAVAPKGPPN